MRQTIMIVCRIGTPSLFIVFTRRFPCRPLISVAGGRFPAGITQSPRRYAPAGLSVDADSAGVVLLHFNQL